MSALRILALSYLASASVFVVAATLVAHPGLGRDLQASAQGVASRLQAMPLRTAWDDLLDSLFTPPAVVRLALAPESPADRRTWARVRVAPAAPYAVELTEDRLGEPEFSASVSMMILPDLEAEPPPRVRPPEPRLARPKMPRATLPSIDVARAPAIRIPAPPPLDSDAAPDRAAAAARRFKASLTPEMLQNFELFLYVSKAARGPLAQRMYVFGKQDGELTLLHDWAASTGRERREVNARGRSSFTGTPAGTYQLDPARMYRKYRSWSWDQPMPYAMFFNWERQGLQTGLAIHAAVDREEDDLGARASAGCVRLSLENAQTLYELVRSRYHGPVPRFAYNGRSRTLSNAGAFSYDASGRLRMTDGYKVLIRIEDYGGRETVAALY